MCGYCEQVMGVESVCGVWVEMGWGRFCISYLWVLGFHVIVMGVGDVRQRYMGWVRVIRVSGL